MSYRSENKLKILRWFLKKYIIRWKNKNKFENRYMRPFLAEARRFRRQKSIFVVIMAKTGQFGNEIFLTHSGPIYPVTSNDNLAKQS